MATGKVESGGDSNFDSTRAGWHDDGAEAATGADEPVFIPDQWQSGEWNQGADPNWDTTQRWLQSWHDASPVAATAAEVQVAQPMHGFGQIGNPMPT